MARTKGKVAGGIGESVVTGGTAEYLGICSTCNAAPDCAHRIRNSGVAIWDCENYDDHVDISSTELNGGLSSPAGSAEVSSPGIRRHRIQRPM